MTTPLDKALKRLAELQREIAEVTKFIALYQHFDGVEAGGSVQASLFEEEPQLMGTDAAGDNVKAVHKSVRKARKDRLPGATPKEIADTMERVIRERGEPMSRGQIVEALERREIEIPAKDKCRYVGTIAWRNKARFPNVSGRGYWVKDAGSSFVIGEPAVSEDDDEGPSPDDQYDAMVEANMQELWQKR
jgi:hypothetical protein